MKAPGLSCIEICMHGSLGFLICMQKISQNVLKRKFNFSLHFLFIFFRFRFSFACLCVFSPFFLLHFLQILPSLLFLLVCMSLTRIMAEISHYCWPCDRNLAHWLMLPDIGLRPNCQELLKKSSENVMATGHYNTYMLLMKVTDHICGIVAVVHSTVAFQCFFVLWFFQH